MNDDPNIAHSDRDDDARSDAEIRAALDAVLGASDLVDATAIELLVTHGVVAMLGEVADYHSKRALERAVAEVPGVREIHDQLQVRSGGAGSALGGAVPTRAPHRAI